MRYDPGEPDYVQAYFKTRFFRAEFRIVAKVLAVGFVAVGLVVSLLDPDLTAPYFEGVFIVGALCGVWGVVLVAWAIIRFLVTLNRLARIPQEFTQLYGLDAPPTPPHQPVPIVPSGGRNNRIEPRLGR